MGTGGCLEQRPAQVGMLRRTGGTSWALANAYLDTAAPSRPTEASEGSVWRPQPAQLLSAARGSPQDQTREGSGLLLGLYWCGESPFLPPTRRDYSPGLVS